MGKETINIKQKTATQVRRHAKGKMSCADQSHKWDLNIPEKEKKKLRQMKRGFFWFLVFYVVGAA